MESVDLDMDEIFDDNDPEDDVGATGVLPDLPDATQSQENDEEENAEVLARLKDLSKGAAKKVVRRPQPKLDPARLTGDRGIPILPKLFDDIKFRGKGHEREDLAVIMRKMEHWAHRLFPKMPFDEVIERVEKLGSKKEVQTCVKKIRLDMPVLDNDFFGSDREEDDVQRGDGDIEENRSTVRAEDMWDELLRDEEEVLGSQQPGTSATNAGTLLGTSGSPRNNGGSTPATPVQKTVTSPGGFTPEQLERIERNKQLALEKRMKKLGHSTPSSQTPLTASQPPSEIKSGEPTTMETDSPDSPERRAEADKEKRSLENFKKTVKDTEIPESQKSDITNNVESCETMSQIYDKGPSQNVTIVDKFAKNAQNWCTAPEGEATADLIATCSASQSAQRNIDNKEVDSSDTSLNDTEKGDESTGARSGKTLKSENVEYLSEVNDKDFRVINDGIGEKIDKDEEMDELSEVIENQHLEKFEKKGGLGVTEVKDADMESLQENEEMSETVENQASRGVDRRGTGMLNKEGQKENSSEEMSEIIEKQDAINVILKEKQNLSSLKLNISGDSIADHSDKNRSTEKKVDGLEENYSVPEEKENVSDKDTNRKITTHNEDEDKYVVKVDMADKANTKKMVLSGDITQDTVDLNDIDFDEEIDPEQLTEDQLMDTLDS